MIRKPYGVKAYLLCPACHANDIGPSRGSPVHESLEQAEKQPDLERAPTLIAHWFSTPWERGLSQLGCIAPSVTEILKL
jgi:hypothetical protein